MALVASLTLIALTVIAVSLHYAPEGYEGESGFHFVGVNR